MIAYVNIALGLVGALWLLGRTTHRWSEYPTEIRLLLVATLLLIFALIETSAELIRDDEGQSFNAITILAVKLFLIYVLWKTHSTKYRTGTRQADGNPGSDPNRDVR